MTKFLPIGIATSALLALYGLLCLWLQLKSFLAKRRRPVRRHAGIGGLQEHSIGETYPYIVSCTPNSVFAFYAHDQNDRQSFNYNDDDSFRQAHRRAEMWAIHRKEQRNAEKIAV